MLKSITNIELEVLKQIQETFLSKSYNRYDKSFITGNKKNLYT